MKKLLLLFTLCLFVFPACQSDPKPANEATPNQATEEVPPEPEKGLAPLNDSKVKLICSPANDPNQEPGYPQNEVFLYLEESKVKVADILACETISPNQYADYQIPENALAAVGGWWAGAGDYVYVVEEGEKYIVKKGEQFEEQDNLSFNYKTVMTLEK